MKSRFLLFCSFFLLACNKGPLDKFNEPALNDISTVKVDPKADFAITADNIPADDLSTAVATVSLDKVPDKPTSVIFSVNGGTLPNGEANATVVIDSDGKAVIRVKAAKPGTVAVKAEIAGLKFSKSLNLSFTTALPDRILVEPETALITDAPGAKVKIKATLLRLSGTPNAGQIPVFYDSVSTSHPPVGLFINTVPSAADGSLSTQYILQDTTYKGYVYIKSYVLDGTKRITGMSRILVR